MCKSGSGRRDRCAARPRAGLSRPGTPRPAHPSHGPRRKGRLIMRRPHRPMRHHARTTRLFLRRQGPVTGLHSPLVALGDARGGDRSGGAPATFWTGACCRRYGHSRMSVEGPEQAPKEGNMKRQVDGVEMSVLPHPARRGWEVVRLNYDAHDPQHLAQVEAALMALARARCAGSGVRSGGETARAAV